MEKIPIQTTIPTPPKTAKEVRAFLRQQRQRLNLSQGDIAKIVCLKHNALISNIETGLRNIPKKKSSDFAKAYQLSEEDIAPLVSGRKLGRIGRNDINDGNSDLDVFPLIKKVVASDRKELTVAELNILIKGYAALQKSVWNIVPELRDILLGSLDTSKTSQ